MLEDALVARVLNILFHFGSGGRAFGPLGLLACLGAGGGLSAPATNSNMGRNRSITLCRSARACPLSRGIQVPGSSVRKSRNCVRETPTLVFSITTLNLLMDILLYVSFEDPRPSWLVKAGSLQDVGRIDPIVLPSSHDMFLHVTTKLEFIYRYLVMAATISKCHRNRVGWGWSASEQAASRTSHAPDTSSRRCSSKRLDPITAQDPNANRKMSGLTPLYTAL